MTQKQPGAAVDDEPEFVPGYDDLAYEGIRKTAPRPPPSAREIDTVLERMAGHNPDAAAVLVQRRSK